MKGRARGRKEERRKERTLVPVFGAHQMDLKIGPANVVFEKGVKQVKTRLTRAARPKETPRLHIGDSVENENRG